MSTHKCNGNEDTVACAGKVKRYRVIGARDWGCFWYCPVHAAVDRGKGFRVEKVAAQEGEELMACEIYGRQNCTRSFHSFEAHDAELKTRVSPRSLEVTNRVEIGRDERGFFLVSLADGLGNRTVSREGLEKLHDAITQLLEDKP